MDYRESRYTGKRYYNWKKFCNNYKDFRKGYTRWKQALKRGHKADLKDYFHNGVLQNYVKYHINKTKSKKYYVKRRELRIALATPKWVDIEAIAEFYANTPEGMTVDHIIPIYNKNVCGLNVPWNLQYLSPKDNSNKRNKF